MNEAVRHFKGGAYMKRRCEKIGICHADASADGEASAFSLEANECRSFVEFTLSGANGLRMTARVDFFTPSKRCMRHA
jgi:hypothetical protein